MQCMIKHLGEINIYLKKMPPSTPQVKKFSQESPKKGINF